MTHRTVVPTPPSEMLLQWASAAPSNGFLSLSAKMGANDSQPFTFSCSSRWKVGPIPSCCSWARPGSTAMKEMLCQLEVLRRPELPRKRVWLPCWSNHRGRVPGHVSDIGSDFLPVIPGDRLCQLSTSAE